jgi:Ca2+-transporting ATPase
MGQLSRVLVWVALGVSLLVPILAWLLAGLSPKLAVLTGLSLAFATIPEELPVIISLVLALGAYRLSRKRAIVKRLPAVEALGTVTVIATDKTGTLTQNQMRVERIEPEKQHIRLLEAGVLCSVASDEGEVALFDPLEVALVQAAGDHQIDVVLLEEGLARDAGDGLRVLAIAERRVPEGTCTQDEAEQELTFMGLVGFVDPPRPEAREAMLACQEAEIRPILITGDHPQTAQAIARRVGMQQSEGVVTGPELDALSEHGLGAVARRVSIYARTTPEHKLRLVQALQQDGEHVTVTGDGTNDAPALRAADIGIAMGKKGTDVAREAADVILADDNFATVVRAIEVGVALFAKMCKDIR